MVPSIFLSKLDVLQFYHCHVSKRQLGHWHHLLGFILPNSRPIGEHSIGLLALAWAISLPFLLGDHVYISPCEGWVIQNHACFLKSIVSASSKSQIFIHLFNLMMMCQGLWWAGHSESSGSDFITRFVVKSLSRPGPMGEGRTEYLLVPIIVAR